MELRGNRGEWSELYALLKLLADGRLYCGDASQNRQDDRFLGQRRSSVAGLTEDDRQTVDKERQVGDPMQLRTEVLNL